MSLNLDKLKTFISSKTSTLTGDATNGAESTTKPQVGFKISFNDDTKQLKVRVIGARHLPALYGNSRPEGYLIKVRVFPGRDKYETQLVKDSWPTYNEEFEFIMQTVSRRNSDEEFSGRFVVLTAYAVLSHQQKTAKTKSRSSFDSLKKIFSVVNENESFKREENKRRSSNRLSLCNRRTIGAVTYNLEPKFFTLKLRNNFVGTPDVWREIQDISSGLEIESRESKKGALEVTLAYSTSEDGNNDLFEVSLSRLRCSMNTMMEHEKLKGSLYIKMKAMQQDELISKWKSGRFEPTISLKIEPQTAVLQAFVKNSNLNDVQIFIILMCKNVLGKKTVLGQIVIDNNTKIWKQIVANPSSATTRMMNLE